MSNWKDILIASDVSIFNAIEILDKTAKKLLIVVDDKGSLLGTITDGDIRRSLLKKISMDEQVSKIMNKNPMVLKRDYVRDSEIIAKAVSIGITKLPVVNEKNVVIDLYDSNKKGSIDKRDNFVVLMAGGLGTRLFPLTKECPKPMLKVGEKPILETILNNFKEQGFYKFYISVNYMSEVIQQYFGDGSKWNVEIKYLKENTRLGTAGALSLIEETTSLPLIVMNGDLLTKIDFNDVLEFHHQHKANATICVKEYDFQVPYGVVEIDDSYKISNIEEKPSHSFFVNAGAYVLGPETLGLVPSGKIYDMTTLFDDMMEKKQSLTAFPVREYWLDIGRPDDFQKAKIEFQNYFDRSEEDES